MIIFSQNIIIVSRNLDGLVWWITDDLPNSSNFLLAKLSRFTVCTYAIKVWDSYWVCHSPSDLHFIKHITSITVFITYLKHDHYSIAHHLTSISKVSAVVRKVYSAQNFCQLCSMLLTYIIMHNWLIPTIGPLYLVIINLSREERYK